jgi:hypothetical protein
VKYLVRFRRAGYPVAETLEIEADSEGAALDAVSKQLKPTDHPAHVELYKLEQTKTLERP